MKYELEIISPCFCAGADQSMGEIRAPSIRGQLRWWFRILSGTPRDENAVFGTVAGSRGGLSSAFIVRVVDFKKKGVWTPPEISQNNSEYYVWHFPYAGKTRWKSNAVVPPGSTFTLDFIWRRTVEPAQTALFEKALHAFLLLGTIGLRGTRGLGAFACKHIPGLEEQKPCLEKAGLVIRERIDPREFGSFESALKDYSSWFRYRLRKEFPAKNPSPLGSSDPRQTSAVRFRPLKLPSGQFTWIAYEAPHARVLDPNVRIRTERPILEKFEFSGGTPSAPPQRR